jgi:hypothetical protein
MVDPPEGVAFFGPIFSAKNDRVRIQCLKKDGEGRSILGVGEIDPEGEVGRISGLEKVPAHVARRSAHAFAAQGDRFIKAHGTAFVCLNESGRFRWSLGPPRMGRTIAPRAVCLDGKRLLCSYAENRLVEAWELGVEDQLGETAAEIDNTLPDVGLASYDQPDGSAGGVFRLRGRIAEPNLKWYTVSYRRVGPWSSRAPSRPGPWRRLKPRKHTEQPAAGVLAEWKVAQRLRDVGLEWRVEALDLAGNTNEAGVKVAFDDDGDGLTNAEEVALGTDPRVETRRGAAARIQADLEFLLQPYLAAGRRHHIPVTVFDLEDPENPRQLDGARCTFSADAGRFAADRGDAPTTRVTGVTGGTSWEAPELGLTETGAVTFTVTFPRSGVDNVLYEQTRAVFTMLVCRDDDGDWARDVEEAESADSTDRPLRGNRDSDGDGVVDGLDLAPRQSYDQQWRRVYPPHTLAYEMRLRLYGIGGTGSKVVKSGKDVRTTGILSRQSLQNSAVATAYLNKVFFDRDKKAGKREPWAIARWLSYNSILKNDKIGQYNYGGKLHPEYEFHYYADEYDGTAVVDNADTIDARRLGKEAGIHQAYLRTAAPAMEIRLDRRVKIQWRITRSDETGTDEDGSSKQMAWLVEAFFDPGLEADKRTYSDLALARVVDGDLHLYEAEITVPAQETPRDVPMYLRLTPAWMAYDPAEMVCPYCRLGRVPAGQAICPRCGKKVNRVDLEPVIPGSLTVSGVTVQTMDTCLEWVKRLEPRPGRSLDYETFTEVVTEAEADLRAANAWPPDDSAVTTRKITLDDAGTTRTVMVVSVRGMEARDDCQKPEERKKHIAARAAKPTARLDQADVVLLVATTRRRKQLLFDAVDWGDPGAWYLTGRGLQESPTDGAGGAKSGESHARAAGAGEGDVGDADGAEGNSGESGAAENFVDLADRTTTILTVALGLYGGSKDVCEWFEQANVVYGLKKGQSYPWSSVQGQTTGDAVFDQSITIQKRHAGDYFVQRRTIMRQPATVEMPGGVRVIDHSHQDVCISFKHEKVTNLADSKILEQGADVDGNVQARRSQALENVSARLEVGAIVVSNGLQIYHCFRQDDVVGMFVYTGKMGVELSQPILASTKQFKKARWMKGLSLGKAGAKVSLVAVAAGVIETGYCIYRYNQADSDFDRLVASREVAGCAIDAGIACVEPWGGLILASWTLGANATKVIIYFSPWRLSSITSNMDISPGSGITFLFDHWRPSGVPHDIASDAGKKALEAAEETVEQLNTSWHDRLVVFVVPD